MCVMTKYGYYNIVSNLIIIRLHLPLHNKEHNRLLAMLGMNNVKWVHHLDAASHNQILRIFLMLWWYVMVIYVLQ